MNDSNAPTYHWTWQVGSEVMDIFSARTNVPLDASYYLPGAVCIPSTNPSVPTPGSMLVSRSSLYNRRETIRNADRMRIPAEYWATYMHAEIHTHVDRLISLMCVIINMIYTAAYILWTAYHTAFFIFPENASEA